MDKAKSLENSEMPQEERAFRWKALSSILDSLLDIDAGDRRTWIATHVVDLSMRATLESLLDEAGEFADTNSLDAARIVNDASAADIVPLRELGEYRLEQKIADGGMASVWRARRIRRAQVGAHETNCMLESQSSDPVVAIKLPHRGVLAGDIERFRREGKILATLAHPNIARLIDTGVDEEGAPYMVLTYVDGAPITEYATRERLSLHDRIALFQQVLAAVQYAHSRLVLHRDLKPANILVTESGEVKLLDFGVAKLISENEQAARGGDMTLVYGRAMTPLYASPEQLAGESISISSDVYSLGLVLFELLVGKRVRNSEVGGPTALLAEVLASEPSKPSTVARAMGATAAIESVRLRGELDWIIGKALAIRAEERYTTIAAFADDLSRYVANEPVTARAPTRWYRTKKFVQRNRMATFAALAAVVGISATAAIALWQRDIARTERDAATAEVARRVRSHGFMLRLISEYMPKDKPMTSVELLDVGVSAAETYFKDDPSELVAMLLRFNGRFMEFGETERETRTTFKALDHAKRSGDANLIAGTQCMAAKIAARQNIQTARDHLAQGKASLARAADPSVGIRGECWFNEIAVLLDAGDYTKANAVAAEAVAFFRPRPQAKAGVHFASLLNMQGRTLTAVQRFDEAEITFRELLELDRAAGMQASVGNWISHANLINVWLYAGDFARADAYLRETLLPLAQNDLTRMPPVLLLRLAAIAAARGDRDRAAELLQMADKENVTAIPLRHIKVSTALTLCQIDGSKACLSRTLPEFAAATRDRYQFNPREQAVTDLMNAHVEFAQARLESALACIERGIALVRGASSEGSLLLGQLFDLRSRVQLARKDFLSARADAEAAIALFEQQVKYLPDRSARYAELLTTRAEVLAAMGERAHAFNDATRARRILSQHMVSAHVLFNRLDALHSAATKI